MYAATRPRTKKCLKLWLGTLLTLSYILIILFTLWTQKRKELNESLERVELPSSINRLPKVVPVQELPKVPPAIELPGVNEELNEKPNKKDAVKREKDDTIVEQKKDFRKDEEQQNAVPRGTKGNETELRIVTYPNKNKRHFATFGFTTPRSEDYFYAFSAPLAVRAWRRVGYECLVFIIGDINEWMTRDTLKHIYSELVSLRTTIVFLKSKPDNEILLSQACRLFAANYFTWTNPENTFIATTDVDLWPLDAALFDIPNGKKIMSLNSDCCGTFDHGSHIYKLLPLGNIVTNVDTWKDIVNVDGFFPRTVPEIIDYFFRDFGPLALERTRKDEYIGWYMDQRMISMKLSDWMAKYGGSDVQFVPRDVGRDRIDQNYWMPYSLHGRSDVHILPGAYKPGVWEKLRPLIKLMYSQDEEYEIVEYREKFMKFYIYSQKFTER